MQTNFTEEQLKIEDNKSSEKIFKKCVHCGMCNATCPTFNLLGDELDGPRGRIYLIQDMLENEKKPTPNIVKHIDRCLSCYSCMTTCPAEVNYMHLIDHGRKYIEKNTDNVGKNFAEEARKIYYGETKSRPIRGESTESEAQELAEEGIPFSQLPWNSREDA